MQWHTRKALVLFTTFVGLLPTACETVRTNCEDSQFIGMGLDIGSEFSSREGAYNASLDDSYFYCDSVADCAEVEPQIVCPEGSQFNFCPIYIAASKVQDYEAGLPALGDGLCGCIDQQMVMSACVFYEKECIDHRCHNPYIDN